MSLPNALVFESFWGLLAFFIGVVAVAAIGWAIAYRIGQRRGDGWRRVLEQLPVGVRIYNRQKQPLLTNHTASGLLPRLDSAVLTQAQQVTPKGEGVSLMVRGGDDMYVRLQSDMVGSDWVVVTLQDMTDHQRRHTDDRVFLQGLSHELQTPLTAIQGHLAHIGRSINGQSVEWRGSLEVAQDEIARLAWLTPNILTLLKLDAGQPLNRQASHLTVIAEEAVQQLWDKAHTRSMSLHVQSQSGLSRVMVDRGAWKQIFLNLIDNGIKYGKTGGTVTIALSETADAQRIRISDDGPGIAPSDIPRLFTRLYRGDHPSTVPGSGLGLAIVRLIIEQHGGSITCTSVQGENGGTTFDMVLPLT